MTVFDKAIAFVLANEGGYSNDKDDRGGETNFGISSRTLHSMRDEPLNKIPIKEWTKDQVIDFYKRRFWDYGHFGSLIYDPLVIKLFDMAVNLGCATAIRLLQKSYNSFRISSLQEDGKLGPKSSEAINYAASEKLLVIFIQECINHYYYLVKKNPSLDKFLNGWITRCHKMPKTDLE